MKVLAIIPARKGSKGIKRKNTVMLKRKPLIKYTLEAANNSKLIDRIVVSTDGVEITAISSGYAEIITRPAKYATHSAKTFDVIKHTIDYFEKNENFIPHIVTILSPTTPFRTSEQIDQSIRKLIKTKSDIVVGVQQIKQNPDRVFRKTIFDSLIPFNKNFEIYHQRQVMKKYFYPTGSIYTFWTSNIFNHNSIYGDLKISPLEIKDFSIDIDNEIDLKIAESLICTR